VRVFHGVTLGEALFPERVSYAREPSILVVVPQSSLSEVLGERPSRSLPREKQTSFQIPISTSTLHPRADRRDCLPE
jgi:hypothetical protein